MLWSPSEVLAYMKDDKTSENIDKKQADRLFPTAPYGGFQTWPSSKEDFILIAENSEIHGPNPLFTIPKLDSKVDLNLLSTHILSADYQGLSNNKLLPGKNAQLLMPDIATDIHVAVVYFFLFDSEARGFVRPTCLAYFTSDKNKLANSAAPIFKRLVEASTILQHFNISCTIDDLKLFKESVISSREASVSKSGDVVSELLLKDIQEVLDIVEGYKGNDVYDNQFLRLMGILKKNISSKDVQDWISTPLQQPTRESHRSKLSCRPNTKTCMKDLYHICDKGVILGLYHLFITHQHFKRKYENIVSSEDFRLSKKNCIHFGACVKNSNRKLDILHQNKCILKTNTVPTTFSLEDDDYFMCLNTSFEKTLLKFINWGKESEYEILSISTDLSSCDFNSSAESVNSASASSGYLSCTEFENEKSLQPCCGHIVPMIRIWDLLECIKLQNPGMEATFLRILKLFDNSQGLMFSVLTRSPIIIISSPGQLQDAMHFVTALSIFIPRKKRESIFVDINRQEPLTEKDFNSFVAVNICLDKSNTVEDLIPIELMPRMCILNLKDCSLTAPAYTGRLIADLDQRLRILPVDGPVFPVLVGFLSEIEYVISWWSVVTSSAVESSELSSYVLSKGYTRSDMQIIEKLFRLWES